MSTDLSNYNVFIYKGNTFKLDFKYTDKLNRGIDLSNYTAKMEIRRSKYRDRLLAEVIENYPTGCFGRGVNEDFTRGNGILGYTGGIILNYEGINGNIHLEIDTETTFALPVGKHSYDLQLVENSTGIQRTILRGNVEVLPVTTKIPRLAPEFVLEPGLTVEYGDVDPGPGEEGGGSTEEEEEESGIFSGSNAWGTDIPSGSPSSSIQQGQYFYVNSNINNAEGIDYQYYIDYTVDQGELIYFSDLIYEITHSNYYSNGDNPVPEGQDTIQTDTYIWRVGSTNPIESGTFLDGTPWVVDNGDLYLIDCAPKEQIIETNEGHGIVGRTVINPDLGKMKVDEEWTGATFPKQVLSDHRRGVLCTTDQSLIGKKSYTLIAQPLVPGNGFAEQTETPALIGDGVGPFSNKVPIARWNVVPFQEVKGLFNIGVVAFHGNEIEKVEFIADGGFKSIVKEMTVNPTTGNREYWCTLNPSEIDSDTADKMIEIRAVIYPVKGQPIVLQGDITQESAYHGIHSLYLINNSNNSLPIVIKYVNSETGNDAQEYGTGGTKDTPYKTIARAALEIGPVGPYDLEPNNNLRHCEIRLLNEGEHVLWYYRNGNGNLPEGIEINGNYNNVRNNEWITVLPDPEEELNPDNVIMISQGEDAFLVDVEYDHPDHPYRKDVRDRISKIKYKNVKFDLSTIREYDAGYIWFDSCVFEGDSNVLQYPEYSIPGGSVEGSPYWSRTSDINFATNCTIKDTLLGFVGFNLVRNCHADTIYADIFVNSYFVIDSTSKDVAGTELEYHSDTHQYFKGGNELPKTNVIVFGVRHDNPAYMQAFFMDHASNSPVPIEHKNFAFVDIAFDDWRISSSPDGGPGNEATQLNRLHENVIFAHVSVPWQRLIFREDASKTFTANDVMFNSCIFDFFGREIISGESPNTEHGIPPGVILKNCHVRKLQDMELPGGEPNGIIENLSVGGVTLQYIEASDEWIYTWEGAEQSAEPFGGYVNSDITNKGAFFNYNYNNSYDPDRSGPAENIAALVNPFDYRAGVISSNPSNVSYLSTSRFDLTQGWDYQPIRIESGDMVITQTPYTGNLLPIDTDNAPLAEFPFTESWGCFSVVSSTPAENSFRPPINWDPRDKQNRPIFTEQDTFDNDIVTYPNYTLSEDPPEGVSWGNSNIAYSSALMNRLGPLYLAMHSNRTSSSRGPLKAQASTQREYGGVQGFAEEKMMLSCFDPNVAGQTRDIFRRILTQRGIDGYGAIRSLGKNVEGYGGGHHNEYGPRVYFAWAVTESEDIFNVLELQSGNTANSTNVVYDNTISNDDFGEEHMFDELLQSQLKTPICSFRHYDLNIIEVNTQERWIKVERPLTIGNYKNNNIGHPPMHLSSISSTGPAGGAWGWSSNEGKVDNKIIGSYVRTKQNGLVVAINRIINISVEIGDGTAKNPQYVKFYLQENTLNGNETHIDMNSYLVETKDNLENVIITYGLENTGAELGLNNYSYSVIAHTLSNHLIGKAKGGRDNLPHYGKVAWDKSLRRATSMSGKEMILNPKNVNSAYNVRGDLYYALIRQEIANGILLDKTPTEKGGTSNPDNWYPLPSTRTWEEIEYPPYEIVYWSSAPSSYNGNSKPFYNWSDNSTAFQVVRTHSFYTLTNGYTIQLTSRSGDCPQCFEWGNLNDLTLYVWPSGYYRPLEMARYYLQENTQNDSTGWTANWKLLDSTRNRVHGWNRGLISIFFANKNIPSSGLVSYPELVTESFKPSTGTQIFNLGN